MIINKSKMLKVFQKVFILIIDFSFKIIKSAILLKLEIK